MGWTPWDCLDTRRLVAGGLITLLIAGVLVRNLLDATTSADVVHALGWAVIVASLFGHRLVSPDLDDRSDGILLLLVCALVAGVEVALASERVLSPEFVVPLGALALLALALIVGPHVDLSTRAVGGLLASFATVVTALGWFTFGTDDGVGLRWYVTGGLLALFGLIVVYRPTVLEALDRSSDG